MKHLRQPLTTLLWRLVAIVSFLLGVIGALLPIMPTVPFLLLSAWAAGKGWPRFEQWMLAHRIFGPPIVRWRERGAVSRNAKWLASTMMLTSALVLQLFTSIHLWVRMAIPLFLLSVMIWLWLRPEE